MFRSTMILLIWLPMSGCVSIGVQKNKLVKSDDVNYDSPKGGFQSLGTDTADASWINRKSGNVISFQSSCNEVSDPSLESMLSTATSGITKRKDVVTTTLPYNGRQALRRKLSGELDGVRINLDLVALKKNKCNYIFTYVGLPKRIKSDQKHFDNFLKGFEAP